MFNLDDCIAFITCQSGKIFAEALEKGLRPYNITRAQWIAMHYIQGSKNITQRELADKMSVKQPTVVRLLQKMEAEGYLQRSGTYEDKRVKCLELTDKGDRAYHDILPVAEKFKNETVAGIDEKDLQTLKDALNIMIKNASKL